MSSEALKATLFACVSAFLFGFHISTLNALQSALSCTDGPPVSGPLGLPSCIPMTEALFGGVTTAYAVGGLIGSLRAGNLAASRGRKGALVLSSWIVIVGSLVTAVASSYVFLVVGRLVTGIGAGVATVGVPLLIASVAPPSLRGPLGVCNQLAISFGIPCAIAVAIPLAAGDPSAWRISQLVSAAIATMQIIAAPTVRGEPYVASKDEEDEATDSAQPLLPDAIAQPALGVMDVIKSSDPMTRRGLWVVVLAMVAQQLSGINAVFFYSTRILEPVIPTSASFISLSTAFIGFVLTAPPVWLIERVGRRPLFTFSCLGMVIGNVLLAYSLNASAGALSVVGIVLTVAAFSFGLGPLPFIFVSEVLPAQASGAGGSIGLAVNWVFTILVGIAFNPLRELLGPNVFLVFSVSTGALLLAILSLYH